MGVDSTNLPDVDINQIATDLNGKMDRDGVNASCPVVISRTANNQGGIVEIWSDGYCVQTGLVTSTAGWVTTTFPIEFIDTNYNIQRTNIDNTDLNIGSIGYCIGTKYTTGFNAYGDTNSAPYMWRAEGYIR